MKSNLVFVMLLWSSGLGCAQSLDDLNLQVHGYVAQSFLISSQNNWNTTDSSNGSAAWTDAVLNLTAQPDPKLRIGLQARYFLLGDYGNKVTVDFAQADYKFGEKFGVRAGKVKSPIGLLNESQDIDPAQLWVLLPQSVYPIGSRDSVLAHFGGVVYGAIPLGEHFGKLEYRAYGGERLVSADDAALAQLVSYGLQIPNGMSGRTYGGTLRWQAPLDGLVLGATEGSEHWSGNISGFGMPGTLQTDPFNNPSLFGKYERKRVMVAGEYRRMALQANIAFSGAPSITDALDFRLWYAMASYKVSSKISGGLYYSSANDHQSLPGPGKYQKDWALCGRYDFNSYLYGKVEQHIMDGTLLGYSSTDNPNGLAPNARMTLFKLGVSF